MAKFRIFFIHILLSQARKEAEELQKEGRGAIVDADIFTTGVSKAEASHVRGKALALNILKKAAASQQNHLLRNKGFGLVLTKQKVPSSGRSLDTSEGSEGSATSSVISCEEDGNQAGQNSLSLLGDYGMDTSDSD